MLYTPSPRNDATNISSDDKQRGGDDWSGLKVSLDFSSILDPHASLVTTSLETTPIFGASLPSQSVASSHLTSSPMTPMPPPV